jgi:hypothetical protein
MRTTTLLNTIPVPQIFVSDLSSVVRDNIKMELHEAGWRGMDWIHLHHVKDS